MHTRRRHSRCLTGFLIVAWVLISTSLSFAQDAKQTRPRVLILGTYHFTGNEEQIKSDKRQKEVIALVHQLKEFAPTRIGVEVPVDSSSVVNEEYQQFRMGKYELGEQETYQIGFRLAKELNHSKIFPIDWRNEFDLKPVLAFAGENGQMRLIQGSLLKMNQQEANLTAMVKTKSLIEILRFLNSDEAIDDVDRLMLESLVHVGTGENYVGTDVLADWYERNLKIFTNIVRTIENDDDRLLVIIGAGHASLLSRFVRDSRLFELEKPDKYLQ